jgi:hypothetical protein
MRLPLVTSLGLLALAACRLEHAESGRPPGPPTVADSLARIEQDSSLTAEVESALRVYYERFSARDWRGFRAAFWPGATITTKWIPPGERLARVKIQSLDEFVRRAPDGPGRMAVFSERMLHAHVTGYGDVADAWVIYEGRWGRTRDSVATVRGIDAFHLYRDQGTWRIVGLTFTPEQSGRPLSLPPRRERRAAPAAAPPTPAPAAPRSAS